MLTMKKYTELKESLLSNYLAEWPDYDLTLPSYQQAQEQERNGTLLLESEDERTVKVKNFEKRNEKILESWEGKSKGEKKVKGKTENIDEQFRLAFSEDYERPEIEEPSFAYVYSRGRDGKWAQTAHSKLDEREHYRTLERQKKKVEDTPLTEAQQILFDEACGVKKKEIDHSLDEAFEEIFGKTQKGEVLTDIQEAALGDLLIENLELNDITIEESSNGAPFKFRGRALKAGRINRNNRRYRKDIVEKALGEAQSQVLTIRDGHPKKNDTAVSPVIGKVVFGELDAEGWMPYTATLSNTSRSRDIQELLRDKVIGSVSLRSRGRTAVAKMDGESIEDVIELNFRGLDLVSEGSERGAGVDEILNSLET